MPETEKVLKILFPNLFCFERRNKREARHYIFQDHERPCKIIFGVHGSFTDEPHLLWDDYSSKM